MNTRGHEVIWNCTSKLDLLIYMVVHGCLRNNRCKFERFPEQTTSWQWHWNKVNGNWMKYDESKAIEMHWVPAKLKSTYRPPAHEPSTLINPHQPFGSVHVGRTFSFPLQSSQASRHFTDTPTPTSSHRDRDKKGQNGQLGLDMSWHYIFFPFCRIERSRAVMRRNSMFSVPDSREGTTHGKCSSIHSVHR